eukprot:403374122
MQTQPIPEEQKFTCVFKNCLKSFARSSRLEIHIKTKHLFQDLHKCDFQGCQKSFAERGNLIVHIRTHTGEKPFQCKDCGKQFSSIGNFKDHERRHSNTKPYQCRLCGIEYYRNYQVKKHLRNKHTGEKIQENILKNIQTNQLNKNEDQKYKTKSKSPSKDKQNNYQNDESLKSNNNQIHQTSFNCQNSSVGEKSQLSQVLNYQNNNQSTEEQKMNLKFETKNENFKLFQQDFSSIKQSQSSPDQDMDEYDFNFFQNLEKQVQNLKNPKQAANNDKVTEIYNNFSGFPDQSSNVNFIPNIQQNNYFQIKGENCENNQSAFLQNPQIQRDKTVFNMSNQETIYIQQDFNPLNQTVGQYSLNLIENHYTCRGSGNSPSRFLSISTQQDSNTFLYQECETFTQQLSSSMNRPKTSQIFDSSRYASLELVQNELLFGSISQEQLRGQDYRVLPKVNYYSNQMGLNQRGNL